MFKWLKRNNKEAYYKEAEELLKTVFTSFRNIQEFESILRQHGVSMNTIYQIERHLQSGCCVCSDDMYSNEKPEELIKKVMNDGWNRIGGSNV